MNKNKEKEKKKSAAYLHTLNYMLHGGSINYWKLLIKKRKVIETE